MRRDSFKLYEINKNTEEHLWSNCLFVFDTSALLDFYSYPESTVKDIFSEILTVLHKEDRLWIPNHVQFEFLKNRKNIIDRVINDTYKKLEKEELKVVFDGVNNIDKNLESVKKKTCKNEKHPYLNQASIDKAIESFKKFKNEVDKFRNEIENSIKVEIDEIEKLKSNDYILNGFEEYLKVGENYSYTNILKIVEEGALRYQYEIPPGYMDLKEAKKKGTQIFGDLIIWKQILDYASKLNKNVVFICNDLKEDWCYTNNRNRITSPREELIKEFNDTVNRKFWMYNQAQFLYNSNIYLKSKIDKSKIEEVDNLIFENKPLKMVKNSDYLVFQCGKCGEINRIKEFDSLFDFEATSGRERGMGPETHYQSYQPFLCKKCDDEIKIWFNFWEYPQGSLNFEDHEIENGVIFEHPDFVSFFWEGYQYPNSFDEDYYKFLDDERKKEE